MTKAGTPTVMPDGKLLLVADDERGRELEIVAFRWRTVTCLVIQVMPTALRRNQS